LLNVHVGLELSFVHNDGPVVDIAAYPEFVLKVGVADELAVHAEPRDLSGDDGAGGEDGADLVAHGCSARLLEDLSNSCEGTCVKAELDDAGDVFSLDGDHVGFDAV